MTELGVISGTLDLGIFHNGKWHKDFKMRLARVNDSIEAEKESSGKSSIEFMVTVISRQLLELGDIPKDEITPKLLTSLYDDDLEVLQKAKGDLKKKLMEPVKEIKNED